jgi:hypothetical protein
MRSFPRCLGLGAAAAVLALTACAQPLHPASAPPPSKNTMTVVSPANYTEHSYRGKPDLGLTLAIVQAGGGTKHFDSARLFRAMAGPFARSEFAKLERLYGKARMAAFMQTMNFAMRDLLTLFAINHIALPAHPSVSPNAGPRLATAIYRAGVMPTGKYDCGYMMEHLMTHPIHVVLMHDVAVAHGHGPAHNANLHIIMTRMIADLRDAQMGSGGSSGKSAEVQAGAKKRTL